MPVSPERLRELQVLDRHFPSPERTELLRHVEGLQRQVDGLLAQFTQVVGAALRLRAATDEALRVLTPHLPPAVRDEVNAAMEMRGTMRKGVS